MSRGVLRLTLILLAFAIGTGCKDQKDDAARSAPTEPPSKTVLAFADALKKRDFKAMANLVVGGKADFDYSQLLEEGSELGVHYTDFTIKMLEEKVTEDVALVRCHVRYTTDASWGGGQDDERVPLKLVDGSWKIVPYTAKTPTGYFFERLAGMLTEPEKVVEQQNATYEPTRNRTPETIKLGQDRSEFFNDILTKRDPGTDPEKYTEPPYSGYKSMTMVEHTNMLWPVGRADEVIFLMSGGGPSYLTCWRRVDGKPKRMWQVALPDLGKGRKLSKGTLARWLKEGPARMPSSLRTTLQIVRPYAVYIESGAIGIYYCYVVFKDGSTKAELTPTGDQSIQQPSEQAHKRGFFITPDELALWKR